jgi:hypothetical protein
VRLRKLVDHMVSRLQQPDGRLYASVVDNIVDLINVLPDLNLTNDPALNNFVEEIRARLCSASAKQLKADELLRAATAQEASDIATRMAAYMEYANPSAETNMPVLAEQPNPQPPAAVADQIFSQMSAYVMAQ